MREKYGKIYFISTALSLLPRVTRQFTEEKNYFNTSHQLKAAVRWAYAKSQPNGEHLITPIHVWCARKKWAVQYGFMLIEIGCMISIKIELQKLCTHIVRVWTVSSIKLRMTVRLALVILHLQCISWTNNKIIISIKVTFDLNLKYKFEIKRYTDHHHHFLWRFYSCIVRHWHVNLEASIRINLCF